MVRTRPLRPLLFAVALLAAACGAEAPPPSQPPVSPAPPAVPTAEASAPSPPALRLPHTATPARVTASLTVVPGKPEFDGVVDIDVKVNERAPLLWLNATALTITEAHADAMGKAFAARTVAGGDDFVGLVFDEPLPAGPAKLHLTYRGKVSDKDDRGLFVEDEDGASYVFTQFESTDARRAFPCFDEPSYKVPWQLTLHVPAATTALSNTTVASETPEPGGMKAVRFAETKPLPSYLVAFTVGPWDLVDAGKAGKKGVPIRVVVPHGKAREAAYAAKTSPSLIAKLEEVTGVPFPYDKLDLVPVPRLNAFGAMENPGLITFARHLLLAKPEEDTVRFEIELASVGAHEMGHHWFGDLVTTAWWDDIWLNEAFATWIEGKVLNPLRPEWHYELSEARSTSAAMNGDSLISARFIRQPIGSKDDIENAFDEITYSKGARVIGMWERYLGEARFRDGIRRYLTSRAHGTATAADFLAAISAEAGHDIAPAFSTFLDQPGVPLVTTSLDCAAQGGTPQVSLRFSQQRYLPLGSEGAPPARWQIPVCARWGGKDEGRACTLLTDESGTLPLPSAKACPAWVVPNDGAAGYYLVAAPNDAVTAMLESGKLTLVERFALIRDLGAQLASGHLPVADVLARVPELLKDAPPQIVRAVVDLVGTVRDQMIPPAERPRFAHFVEKTFGDKARSIGWKPKAKEDVEVRLLRPGLLGFVADRGQDAALGAEASLLATRWLDDGRAVEDDMVDTVLAVAAARGDRALFDRLRAELKKTKDEGRRHHLFGALGSFRDPAIAESALSLVFDGEIDVRETSGLVFQDSHVVDASYAFMKRRYDDLLVRLPSDFAGALPWVAGPYCDESHRADVQAFFKDRVNKLLGAPRTLAKVLERIRLCSAQRTAQEASLVSFLKKY